MGESCIYLLSPTRAKYWRINYRYNGKYRTHAVGIFLEVSLADAREDAAQPATALEKWREPDFQISQEFPTGNIRVNNRPCRWICAPSVISLWGAFCSPSCCTTLFISSAL